MGVDPLTLNFEEGALSDLPPLRVACEKCIDAIDPACDQCKGKGQILAPWVEELVEIFEREGIVRRVTE